MHHIATTTSDQVRNLMPHHLAELRASGLSDATISNARIYSETNYERIAALLNRRAFKKAQAPVIVFPFVEKDGNVSYSRVKPDRPRAISGRVVKYESPVDAPNHIYVPRDAWQALEDKTRELLITEGEKKALKATQEGFPTIGLVGIYGWKDKRHESLLPALERIPWQGRAVRIVYDSDAATNENVRQGEARLAAQLRNRGADVRIVRLPPGPDGAKVGLDDYLLAHHVGELRALLDAGAEPGDLEPVEERQPAKDADPATEAAAFMATSAIDDVPTLRFFRGTFHQWRRGRYVEMPTSEARGRLVVWLNNRLSYLTQRVTGDIFSQLGAQSLLSSHHEAPCWIGPDVSTNWDPSALLVARNAIIHLQTLERQEPTPRFFTPSALDFDFLDDPPAPTNWFRFLDQIFGGDAESVEALQDWFGYCLTPDTRQQKILTIIGPKRSGKGTIARVLRAVVGADNVAGPTLAGLATNFGLWPLVGKTVAIVSDARLSGRTDQAIVTERLLSVSGEDALTIDRKNLEPVTAKLLTRFLILSNELPRLSDSSGALAGRMILLRLRRSFFGAEDIDLTPKLLAEKQSILLWAIAGWRRLRERRRFISPTSGEDLAAELSDLASPVSAFVRDECELTPAGRVSIGALFEAWKRWCAEQGRDHSGTQQVFGRDLGAAFPHIRRVQHREDGDRGRYYEGIRLRAGTQWHA